MPFDKSEYDKQYAKDHIKRKFIPFNDTVPEDVALLEWLAKQSNVTAYIKGLIRADMEQMKSFEEYNRQSEEVAKSLSDIEIPLEDFYRDEEAIKACVEGEHAIYVGWHGDYEYRIDVDARKVLTVTNKIKFNS